MKEIPILTSEKQDIIITVDGVDISLLIVFNSIIGQWSISVSGVENGIILSTGVRLMNTIKAYDFYVENNLSSGIDPFNYNDFEKNYTLYVLERADLLKIRGFDVR